MHDWVKSVLKMLKLFAENVTKRSMGMTRLAESDILRRVIASFTLKPFLRLSAWCVLHRAELRIYSVRANSPNSLRAAFT